MPKGDPNRNLVAALSYLIFFITGIVILLVEKEDKFVRFHAMQSTLIFLGLMFINIILNKILQPIDFLGFVSTILSTVIFIIFVTIWAVSMYKAYQGQVFKWPIVGNIAEKNVG